ncbi:MAG: DUF2807 domain-containing protein [Bacteroidales bacterium]|nr:DUF2807 domain-containing protein [Bacteroidales bacterium]
MKRKLDVILLAFVSALCCACGKSAFTSGDLVVCDTIRVRKPFQVIEMCDDINVTLKHCDADNPAGKIVLKTGENLIEGITYKIDSTVFKVKKSDSTAVTIVLNKLIIQDENTLNFLRPYDDGPDMTIYYDSIYMLYFNSNAQIKTADALRGYLWPTIIMSNDIQTDTLLPQLNLEVRGGSGDFFVDMNCYMLNNKYTHGTSCITLSGKVKHAETITNYDCHGIIDGRALDSRSQKVNYYGTNTVYVKVFDNLVARNYNIGRIYYVKYKENDSIWIDNGSPHGIWKDSTFSCPRYKTLEGSNIMPYTLP